MRARSYPVFYLSMSNGIVKTISYNPLATLGIMEKHPFAKRTRARGSTQSLVSDVKVQILRSPLPA